MHLIDDDTSRHQTRPAARRTVLRRLLRPAVLMPAAAVAATVALGVTVAAGGTGPAPATAQAGGSGASAAGRATVLLDRIADVASRTDATPVRDDQLVYVKSLVADAPQQPDGTFRQGRPKQREEWISQRPGRVLKSGLTHQDGEYYPINQFVPAGTEHPGTPAGIDRPTYRWLASLPTDPDALLRELHRLTKPVGKEEEDQAVFERIGELVDESVMPPRTAAALYKAAARIPGVKRTDDAVDAAGRHGIGIARIDKGDPIATEWIFDPHTLANLGRRSYLTRDCSMGEKGDPMGATAVLEHGVVDKYRERP